MLQDVCESSPVQDCLWHFIHRVVLELPVQHTGHWEVSTEKKHCLSYHRLGLCIIMIIVIALKGAIQDFLQSLHCAANCLQHAHSSGQGVIMCKSHAALQALITCSMSCAAWFGETAQLISLTELKSHLFELYFIG